jgi:hypothetical protein
LLNLLVGRLFLNFVEVSDASPSASPSKKKTMAERLALGSECKGLVCR